MSLIIISLMHSAFNRISTPASHCTPSLIRLERCFAHSAAATAASAVCRHVSPAPRSIQIDPDALAHEIIAAPTAPPGIIATAARSPAVGRHPIRCVQDQPRHSAQLAARRLRRADPIFGICVGDKSSAEPRHEHGDAAIRDQFSFQKTTVSVLFRTRAADSFRRRAITNWIGTPLNRG